MSVAPKAPETPGIRLDVGEELRALRVQTLKHVAAIAELQARVGTIEQRWTDSQSARSAINVTLVTGIVTAIGTMIYLVLSQY